MDPEQENLNEEDVPQTQTRTNAPVTDPPPSKSGEEPKKSMIKYTELSIDIIYKDWAIVTLVELIEKELKYDGLLSNARNILNSIHGWLLKSPSTSDVSDFDYSEIQKFWEDPCFVSGVRLTMEWAPTILATAILCFSQEVSPAHRLACMKSDLSLKNRLDEIKSDTKPTTILRLFLSILIVHWTHLDVLMKLDAIMEKPYFKNKYDLMNRVEADADAYKKKNVRAEYLQFNMNSPVDIEELREKLTKKYPSGHQDIEAIVTHIQGEVDFLLEVQGDYNGGRLSILLHGLEGRYNVASIGRYPVD